MGNPFRYFNSSPEVIRLVVMMYVRYPLSLRNVEDLLAERGIDISHETVRFWWNRFGPMFAAEIRKKRVAHMRGYPQWRWHLDEAFVKVNGKLCYLWRAVDCESASNLDPWPNRYNALQLNSFQQKSGVTVGRRSNAPEISNSTSASMIWCSTGVGSKLDADSQSDGQARDQTGRSPAEQRRGRRMGPVRAVGARGRGPAQGDRRGDGLDRFRRRQSGHARPEPHHPPRPGDAAVVADGRQGRTEGPAQRLRGPLPDAPEASAARGRGGDDPGRSRLRRRQAVRIPRQPRFRLLHSFSWKHSGDRGGR